MDRTAFQLAEENELRSLRRSREKIHAAPSHFSLSDEIELLSSGLRSERLQAPVVPTQDQQSQSVSHSVNDGDFKSGAILSNNPVFDFDEIGDADAAADPLSLLLPENGSNDDDQDKPADGTIGPVEQNEGKLMQSADDNFFNTTKSDRFGPILTPPSPYTRVSHTNAHSVLNNERIQEDEVVPLVPPNDVLPAPASDADNVSSLLEKVTAQPPVQYQTQPAPYGVANISDAMVLQVVRQALALTVPRIDPMARYQQNYEEALAKPVETPKDARARRLAILQYKRVTKKPRVVSRSSKSSSGESRKSGTRASGPKRKLTEQEIEEKRIKNRASVQACRQRKKARKTELESESSHYGVENSAMRKSFENTVDEIESIGIRLPEGIKALFGDASQDLNSPRPPMS